MIADSIPSIKAGNFTMNDSYRVFEYITWSRFFALLSPELHSVHNLLSHQLRARSMKPVKSGSQVLTTLHIFKHVCLEATPDEGELLKSPSSRD